jgi:hypothetical protein
MPERTPWRGWKQEDEDLERLMGEPDSTHPPGTHYRLTNVAIILVVLAAILLGWWMFR